MSRDADDQAKPTLRRRALLAAVVAGAALTGYRCSGYPPAGFAPQVLAAWEVAVLRAAAAALLAPDASPDELASLPERVDRYLLALPATTRRELHAAFATLEHTTTLFFVSLSRFSSAGLDAQRAQLEQLAEQSGLLNQIYRALRELCLLGWYQQISSWPAIGYDGPRVPAALPRGDPARMSWPNYDDLRAAEGELPRGVV